MTDARKHLKQHTRPCTCTICGRGFAANYDLRRHRESVHDEGESRYCSEAGCPRARNGAKGPFKRKDKLDEHYKNYHNKRELAATERSPVAESSNNLDDSPNTSAPQTSAIALHVPTGIQDVQVDHSLSQNGLEIFTTEQRNAFLEQENADLRNQNQHLSKQLLDREDENRVLIRLIQRGMEFRV